MLLLTMGNPSIVNVRGAREVRASPPTRGVAKNNKLEETERDQINAGDINNPKGAGGMAYWAPRIPPRPYPDIWGKSPTMTQCPEATQNGSRWRIRGEENDIYRPMVGVI